MSLNNVRKLLASCKVKAPFEVFFARVTPDVARAILSIANNGNRNIRSKEVSCYSQAMTEDAWKVTHQGIAFDLHDDLRDGAHRLTAVVESGVPQVFMVSMGVHPDIMAVIDIGRRRTVADALMIGYQIGTDNHLASVLNIVDRGREGCMRQMRPDEALDAYPRHQHVIARLYPLLKNTKKKPCVTPVVGAIGRALYHVTDKDIAPFCLTFATGEDSGKAPQANKLRNWVGSLNTLSNNTVRTEVYDKTVWAISKYLNGEQFTKLNEAKEELFPIPDRY